MCQARKYRVCREFKVEDEKGEGEGKVKRRGRGGGMLREEGRFVALGNRRLERSVDRTPSEMPVGCSVTWVSFGYDPTNSPPGVANTDLFASLLL